MTVHSQVQPSGSWREWAREATGSPCVLCVAMGSPCVLCVAMGSPCVLCVAMGSPCVLCVGIRSQAFIGLLEIAKGQSCMV